MPGQEGWSIQSREDRDGRTLYSIYIGSRLIVSDARSSDAAVLSARRKITSTRGPATVARKGTGRTPGGAAGTNAGARTRNASGNATRNAPGNATGGATSAGRAGGLTA